MKVTYDPEADALYVCFQKEPAVAETHEINDEIFVDVDEQGHIVGLELLSASKQVPRSELFSLLFENLMETPSTAP